MKKLFLSLIIIMLSGLPVLPLDKKIYEKHISEIPTYPKSKFYDLKKILKFKMKVLVSEDNFYKILDFYIKEMQKKGWELVFPKELEMKIWMEALEKDKSKPLTIMLSFFNEKKSISCNISIGEIKDARVNKKVVIITIYLSDTVLQ